MPLGGPAIYIRNEPRPSHQFNSDVIGRGRDYQNLTTEADHCVISIRAAANPADPLDYPLLEHAVPMKCHVSTDTRPTIFQGGIAGRLHLQPPLQPFYQWVDTFLGPFNGPWGSHVVWLSIGPDYLPVKVLFPVRLGPEGWEWWSDVPKWNVLGMKGILRRRMLCVTSDQVFVFERLRREG
ncbi:MAG: hypothetical protein NTW96_25265 [Planctomycetia bacterium]|nr:hypothetical protein [Planctomycetia bacterium]